MRPIRRGECRGVQGATVAERVLHGPGSHQYSTQATLLPDINLHLTHGSKSYEFEVAKQELRTGLPHG